MASPADQPASSSIAISQTPDWHNLQGMTLAGFKKDYQQLLFLQFKQAGRAILALLAPLVASDWEVSHFNSVFSEIRKRRGSTQAAEAAIRATWIGVGLSAQGYRALGIDVTAADGLPACEGRDAFVAGMAERAPDIGDADGEGPSMWIPNIAGSDAVVVVASDDNESLRATVGDLQDQIENAGGTVGHVEIGHTLEGRLRGHEHFGFRDGISQPNVAGYPRTDGTDVSVPLGEFVLGYPDHTGQTPSAGPGFVDGSYMVFRRLVQDVTAFNAQADAAANAVTPPIEPDTFAAKIVGRWPGGAPLALHPSADPGERSSENDFAFQSNDPDGAATPLWAHIRKVNPRDEAQPQPEDVSSHRMIRRGIPFDHTEHKNPQKGLHFISFVADVARQFEFVQRRWSDDVNFPNGTPPVAPTDPYSQPSAGVAGAGPDPLAGHHADGVPVQYVPSAGSAPQAVTLAHQLVTMTGGEYFFAPSLRALAEVATPVGPPSAATGP